MRISLSKLIAGSCCCFWFWAAVSLSISFSSTYLTTSKASAHASSLCYDYKRPDGQPWADGENYTCATYVGSLWCVADAPGTLGPTYYSRENMLKYPFFDSVPNGNIGSAQSAANYPMTGSYWYTANGQFRTDASGDYKYSYEDDVSSCLDNPSNYMMFTQTNETFYPPRAGICAYDPDNTFAWAANDSPLSNGGTVNASNYVLGADQACCGCGGGWNGLQSDAYSAVTSPIPPFEKLQIRLPPHSSMASKELPPYPFDQPDSMCMDFNLNDVDDNLFLNRYYREMWFDWAGYNCRSYLYGGFCYINGSASSSFSDFGTYLAEYFNGVFKKGVDYKARLHLKPNATLPTRYADPSRTCCACGGGRASNNCSKYFFSSQNPCYNSTNYALKECISRHKVSSLNICTEEELVVLSFRIDTDPDTRRVRRFPKMAVLP